ncbi:MAG: hypothetical protein RI953_2501 [Pseudomonadota bacterium]|jgi:soluble lytic murein transglycosylase-like protein
MERQKTKWRFQNIAALGTLASIVAVCPGVTQADLVERTSDGDERPAVKLAARAPHLTAGAPPLPGLKGSFSDFRMPDEARFWEIHGVKSTPELKRAVQRLSEHLVGTSREKTAAFKYCEARKDTAAKLDRLILTPDGISCLYWRWQNLLKERRAEEAAGKTKDSRSTSKTASVKKKSGRKKQSVATVNLRTIGELNAFSGVSYDTILKKLEFKSEADALKASLIAQESPKDCRLTAARAAVLRDLENFLPSQAVWTSMNELYAITAPCLDPGHEAFEVVNGRLALLHLDRNIFDRGASLLEVTLQGKDLKDEHTYLFWRGFVDSLQAAAVPAPVVQANSTQAANGNSGSSSANVGVVKPRNTYWDRLIEKYPLTLHALVADQITGNDAYDRYAYRPQPNVSAYEGQEWNLENVSHLMAGLYMVKGKQAELDRLARLFEDGVGVLSFESAMFRVKFFEAAGHQRSVIKTVAQSVKTFGSRNISLPVLALLYPVKFRNEIAQQAAYIDPALVFSLIRQESSFNPKATSPVGARGLMQVMPNTARKIDRKRNLDLYDPNTNIRIGSKYLNILWKKHGGDYSRLIASYNAGPNNTVKWESRYRGQVPLLFADLVPFPETRHYVSGLMRHMYWYRALVSHIKETSGAVKINWSWALMDVVPRGEQFGFAKNQVAQFKLENLPWMNPTSGKATAADR